MFWGDTLNVAWDPEGFAKLIFYLLCQVFLVLFRLERFRRANHNRLCNIWGRFHTRTDRGHHQPTSEKLLYVTHTMLCSDWLLVQSVGLSTLMTLSK